jgi:hypothetical protein
MKAPLNRVPARIRTFSLVELIGSPGAGMGSSWISTRPAAGGWTFGDELSGGLAARPGGDLGNRCRNDPRARRCLELSTTQGKGTG